MFSDALSSRMPPSLSSCGSTGMPWIEVVLDDVAVGLPQVQRFAEVGADLAVARSWSRSAPLSNCTPSSFSLIVELMMRLPVRPLSALLNSTPATAWRRIVRSSSVLFHVAAGEQHAVAELLHGAVADRDVVVAAVADAGREALFLAGGVLDQVVGAVDDVAVEVDDDVRRADHEPLTEAVGEVVHHPRALGQHLAAA